MNGSPSPSSDYSRERERKILTVVVDYRAEMEKLARLEESRKEQTGSSSNYFHTFRHAKASVSEDRRERFFLARAITADDDDESVNIF